MKKLAFGIATAAVLLATVPAMAQVDLYAGPGGVGVQFGPGYEHRYHDYYGGYPYGGYYNAYPGPHVWIATPGPHHHHQHWRR